MLLFDVLLWIVIHSTPTTYLRRVFKWGQEEFIKGCKNSRYPYTSLYDFQRYRRGLDRQLGFKSPRLASRTDVHPALSDLACYEYEERLGKDRFRCLELLPDSGSGVLRVRLVTLPIDTGVRYEAISHKWATRYSIRAIECGRRRLDVTTSIYTMLLRLRLAVEYRLLWIDSICINQKDELEKAAQIDRMAAIYKNAYSTIIWLGEEDRTTESAFSLLHSLKEVNLLCERRFQGDNPENSLLSFEQLRQNGLPDAHDYRWKPLMSLLHRPWFTRTWILQEVTLAKSPWVQCGSHFFSWYDLCRIVSDLRNGNVDGRYNLKLDRAWNIGHIGAIYSSPTSASLLQLLYLAHSTRAREYNDQIFAIIGLARDQDSIRPQLDYSKDLVNENYTATALHYLLAGHVEVLNYASDASFRELQHLPSWVPDWSTDAPSIDLVGYVTQDEPYGTKPHKDPRILPEHRNDPSRLCMQGIVDDEVRAVGLHVSSLSRKIARMRSTLLILEQWRHLTSKIKSYPGGEDIDEAFASTIILGRNLTHADRGNAAIYALHAKNIGIQLNVSRGNAAYSQDELAEFRRHMDFSIGTRTFFTTRRGYMGIGPYFLRPGDRIAHFEGGATPFAIRKLKPAFYSLVGGVYIRGLMDREIDLDKCSIIELV